MKIIAAWQHRQTSLSLRGYDRLNIRTVSVFISGVVPGKIENMKPAPRESSFVLQKTRTGRVAMNRCGRHPRSEVPIGSDAGYYFGA